MEEDLEDGDHRGPVVPQHLHRVLATMTEGSLNTGGSKAVHDVTCQAERNGLRCGQDSSLFKCYPEIDVDYFSGEVVNQDVVGVPVTKTKDVPNHGVDSDRSGVGCHCLIITPGGRKLFKEEIFHCRTESGANAFENLQFLLKRGCNTTFYANTRHLPPALEGIQFFGVIFLVCSRFLV